MTALAIDVLPTIDSPDASADRPAALACRCCGTVASTYCPSTYYVSADWVTEKSACCIGSGSAVVSS